LSSRAVSVEPHRRASNVDDHQRIINWGAPFWGAPFAPANWAARVSLRCGLAALMAFEFAIECHDGR
jgi:hypothetical protein